ncbi:hypothetical protein EV356DRAFT_581615 [Viridothelium virens]|uniref:Uncharacterized protein n=1 Tax=Viridothelium virens TaxID=1048519 RepID=A0A6A6GS05_VIRVR|nr:hypothetical protein EV356DRAFT_581615 [Viridothelium virens]
MCNDCARKGLHPFPECRRVRGHFGGCCANCKWQDHAKSCRWPQAPPPPPPLHLPQEMIPLEMMDLVVRILRRTMRVMSRILTLKRCLRSHLVWGQRGDGWSCLFML